jgi:hydroxyacylglutathione hydrolase
MKISWQTPEITVFESSLYRTTSTVVDLGTSVLIVDPNWLPIEIETIFDFVDAYHRGKKQYLVFTHSDYDHIIGAGKFSNATVIASETFAKNEDKERVLRQIQDFDNEYYISRSYPIEYPKADIQIKSDMQKLNLDDVELEFYLAPGHTPDGMFIIIPKLKLWIAGDYLSNIEMPFIDHNVDQYVNTLIKSENIIATFQEILYLIPGHGDIALSRSEIKKRIKSDCKYLQFLNQSLKNADKKSESKIRELINKYSSNPTLITAHEKNIRLLSDQQLRMT